MNALGHHLRQSLDGRVCLVGLGAADRGDDAFGLRLIAALGDAAPGTPTPPPVARTVVAGLAPERHLDALAAAGFDHVLFADAADFEATPGSVVLLDSAALHHRYPQVSTHKLSLSLMARYLAGNGRTRTWLLGAQPESVRPGPNLSATLDATVAALTETLRALWTFEPWTPGDVTPAWIRPAAPGIPQEASC